MRPRYRPRDYFLEAGGNLMKPSLISCDVPASRPLTIVVYDDDIVTLLLTIVQHLTLLLSAGCVLTDREHQSCAQALTTHTPT